MTGIIDSVSFSLDNLIEFIVHAISVAKAIESISAGEILSFDFLSIGFTF